MDGEVICPKTTTIGYFSQTLEVDSSKTIYGELLTVFEPIMALEQEMRDIEVKMASSTGTALDDLMKNTLTFLINWKKKTVMNMKAVFVV